MDIVAGKASLREVGALMSDRHPVTTSKNIKPLHPAVSKMLEEIHDEGEMDPFLGDKLIPYKKVRDILLRRLRG